MCGSFERSKISDFWVKTKCGEKCHIMRVAKFDIRLLEIFDTFSPPDRSKTAILNFTTGILDFRKYEKERKNG